MSIPNDFNTKTIVNFIESDAFVIPSFQRNYVWDIKQASKFIESIIMGLPIPQIFLYERKTNKFLVIDGQQRLMSLYYFVNGRFPKKNKVGKLRIMSDKGDELKTAIKDNDCFTDFKLKFLKSEKDESNRLDKLKYEDLEDDLKSSFDMRTIRVIVIRQINPEGEDSVHEIFHRLNMGGMNLTPQEIRRSMYDSKFYKMLYKCNTRQEWRRFIGTTIPDLHMKDVEMLLRGFAMLINGKSYKPSLVKFLDKFSRDVTSYNDDKM